ncbi:hypothetical protein C6501_08400 [Candidatus Poribacteria bacterium]|nr:MAG: hypothetical protein C6501_08400 [Candidatus Poribacteria bacterium]
MKKQLIILISSLFVIIIGVVFYMHFLKKAVETSILEQVPASKPHQHVTPDGEVVQHTHSPIQLPKTDSQQNKTDPQQETVHPILRIWQNLDLNEIRRKYQPYTVQEMIEKWDPEYIRRKGPGPLGNPRIEAYLEKAEKLYPKEQFLQHLMDNGYPFPDYLDYDLAFSTRFSVIKVKEDFENPETRSKVLRDHRLPEDTTWEELEEVHIKFDIVSSLNEIWAAEADPSVFGGVTGMEGVFIPFKPNTVHIYISEDRKASIFTGTTLTQQQKDDLTMYGVAPEGITVVYTDKEGRPLPSDAKPRFYEREMAALEAAEAHVEQLIADHEALFKTLPKPAEKTTLEEQPVPSQQAQQAQPQEHQSDGSELRANGRRPDIPIDRRNIPPEMLPSEPPSRANIQQWFEVLQELHGGELPKDLRVLQAAINELEEIRQAAADKQQATRQRPPERSAPKPPASPE